MRLLVHPRRPSAPRRWPALATTLALLSAAVGVLPGTGAVAARADEPTLSQNNLRTGWDTRESGLSPTVVSSRFGTLPGFPVKLSGQVYAQPLVITVAGAPEVIVATENDMVYGINGKTGAINWSTSLGTPYIISNCGNVAPNIGVTSAPVYDPGTGDVYLIAEVGTGASTGFQFVGVNPTSGAVTASVPIGGTPVNDPGLTFNPAQQLQRPGLLLLNGWVYAAFGSHCDHAPYVGYVAGVNIASHAETLWTDESGMTGSQAGIWESGGGLVSDGSNRFFLTSGNGVSPAFGPGNNPPGQLAESIVRLQVNSDGSLTARDFFSPIDAPSLDASDTDWGSSGPMGLPFKTSNSTGTSTYYMILQAGKDGRIFILNRNNLGGRGQGPNGTDAHLRYVGRFGGQWGHPAAFRDTYTLTPADSAASNDYAYFVGNNDFLRVLKFGALSTGKPTASVIATSSATFPYASGSPVVTSKGIDPTSAVVWVVHSSGSSGAGTLEAYAATPAATVGWPTGCTTACVLDPIFSASIGTAANFSTPATNNQSVYVGTLDGYLYGFGIQPAAVSPTGASVAFGKTGVGSASTRNATVTASSDVTVTGVKVVTTTSSAASGAAQFAVSPSQVTETVKGGKATPVIFPVNLHKGDKLTAPVKFTPVGPGGVTGSLSFATPSALLPSADVPLAGVGTRPGLYANTSSVQFALVGDHGQFESWAPVGISVPREITITNGGANPEKITGVSIPSGPYQVTGVPRIGTVFAPGQSFVAQIVFAPVRPGTYDSTMTFTSSGGSARVDLSAQGLTPDSLFRASPASVKFGPVPVGKQAKVTITVSNAGNEPATMDQSSALSAPFHAVYRVTRGLPVNAGYDLNLPIIFIPAKRGTFTTDCKITWTDVTGTHTLTIPVSGTGV